MFDESESEFGAGLSNEAARCHSGTRVGAQVASLRGLVFRAGTFSVEPAILARKR